MLGRKPAQDVVKVLMVGRVGAYQRGQHGHEHQRQRDGSTDYERWAAPRALEQDVARPPGALCQRRWSLGLEVSSHRNRILGSRRAANRSVARLRNTTAVPRTSV